ncbi:uncharacterized protein LOC107845496 [Capsicum annuum]|uniref:uncharacterized protein LOC107845496 n=1 Tax=Capsicum annuum TaxID=4072 RepID=UPI0007BEF846|nr:uncharacterized protein LOC107845496 [Capsicum annuum]
MRRFLTDMERKSATTHVLLNCPKVQSYYNLFLSLYGYDAVYSHFSEWFKSSVNDPNNNMTNQFFKDIAWGPSPLVKTMNKYNVNGHKFCTEESSKYYKSNNIGVWVKGDTSNKDGDVDYYGVLQEILELDFPGWPHKKLILFRCKWFDPTPKIGTRVDPHYKIVEVKHTRQYGSYDPFIIAQNVKQVYYAPYPLTLLNLPNEAVRTRRVKWMGWPEFR